MPQSLIIFGNIASGKSSVCRLLAQQLPDHRHVCLDDFRIALWEEKPQLGRGRRDIMAQERCLQALRGPVIYETTAATRFYHQAMRRLHADNQKLYTVHLDCPVQVCLERYNARKRSGHIQAPFAWGAWSIEESMYYFHDRQREVSPQLRINTSRVGPETAVRIILDQIRAAAGGR